MQDYLETEVLTASPPKLQLMLIEAAMRQIGRALQARVAKDEAAVGAALQRAQDIVAEMMAGLNYQAEPALSKQVAAVYQFVFRSLVAGEAPNVSQPLADAHRVLDIERGTWREMAHRYAVLHGAEGGARRPLGLPINAADGAGVRLSLEA